jgi:hypothetical protein
MIVPAFGEEKRLIEKLETESDGYSRTEEKRNQFIDEKKVFYEVGCKIFEINKIFK